MSYATSNASSSWSATTYFTNLGNDPSVEYYLTVSYLQTGFGGIYQTFVDVIVLVNDEPQFDVRCDGQGECGDEYVPSFLNIDVTQYITSQTGGTLQLEATATGLGDWSNTCPGDEEPYFKVQYILSKVRIVVQTQSPTSASGPNEGSGISSNVPFAFTACVAVVMAIFGAVIADTRKKKADVHEVDGIWMQYTLVVFGCILGSQVFFIYTCFTDADYAIYGFSIIVIKVCVMILNGVCLYISTRSNSCDLDWDLVTEYISLYNTLSFLCCLQLKLMYLLPWRTSVFASVSGGFPSFQIYCISYFLFMCESMLIAGVQALFAVHFHDIFNLDKLTRVSFFLSIGFTGVFSVMSCLEMMLIYRSHQARNVKPESKSESRDSLTEKLIEGEASCTGT